jgi:hypothetical protein
VSRRLETIVATCSGKISVELKANNFVERKINAQVTFVQAAPSKRSDATIGFLQILGEQTRRSPKQRNTGSGKLDISITRCAGLVFPRPALSRSGW